MQRLQFMQAVLPICSPVRTEFSAQQDIATVQPASVSLRCGGDGGVL